jgi:hypothetical protein
MKRNGLILALFSGLLLLGAGCSSDDSGDDGGSGTDSATGTGGSGDTGTPTGGSSGDGTGTGSSGTGTGSSGTGTGSSGTATGTGSSGTGTGSSGTGTGTGSSGTGTATGTGSSSGTGTDTGGGFDCGNKELECNNGVDDDGDGHIDLLDPECTGPCDNDEATFQTGIPGDNVDCKQDCFFDGNSGQGEKCEWNLRCDPNNPGEHIGCPYDPNLPCDKYDDPESPECLEACVPMVPNGCDCYGCCRVQTPYGWIDIQLNSHPDCALDNLDVCEECTLQIEECGNPCIPEECELCFGETELPEECDEPGCPEGMIPCETTDDCPEFHYCVTGCCVYIDPEG